MVLRVEVERDEVLLAGPRDLPHVAVRLGGPGHGGPFVAPGLEGAPADLEDGQSLAGARPADPAMGRPFVQRERRQAGEAVATDDASAILRTFSARVPLPSTSAISSEFERERAPSAASFSLG